MQAWKTLLLLTALAGCQSHAPAKPETGKHEAPPAATQSAVSQPALKEQTAAPTTEPTAQKSEAATPKQPSSKPKSLTKETVKETPKPVAMKPAEEAKAAPTPAPAPTRVATMPAEAAKCKACHAIDKRVVGPAWKDVAAKRNGDKAVILANIKKGGSFGWGMGQMPARGMENDDAKLEKLAAFIAGLK